MGELCEPIERERIVIENFDLTGWTLFSERLNSKNYVSSDGKWMLKVCGETVDNNIESLEYDREATMKTLETGVKTPMVKDIVKLPNGELGLIYEYIKGKKSIARAMSEDLGNIEYYAKRFAAISRDMHSKVCDTKKFESMKDRIINQVMTLDVLNDSQKERAIKLLDTVEDKKNFLHGDFQPANFIMTNDDTYVIDLRTIAYGNPEYDIANYYFFTHRFRIEGIHNVFHCEPEHVISMWNYFIKYYFEVQSYNAVKELTDKYAKLSLVCFFEIFKFMTVRQSFREIIQNAFDKEIS